MTKRAFGGGCFRRAVAAMLAVILLVTVAQTTTPVADAQGRTCQGRLVTIDMDANGGDGTGTAGPDVIHGTAGVDIIDGGGGNDVICGDAGDDIITGGLGRDRIAGGPGDDEINGGGGDDVLDGRIGNDTITGGAGDDVIRGRAGDDTINAGAGSDVVYAADGADTVNGGDDDDRVFGGNGNDTLRGGAGNDTLAGGNDNDTIFGDAGDDDIRGNAGDDVLNGGPGIDIINGGPGADRGTGDGPSDTCIGVEDRHDCPDPTQPPVPAAWAQIGPDIDGEAQYDYFGRSVALSADGTTLATGAPFNDGNGSTAGHVRVFERTDNAWTQIGPDIDGEEEEDYFGNSLALSADGTTLASGAGYPRGYVRVFARTGATWTQIGPDIEGEGEGFGQFGTSMALSADGATIAIGETFGGAGSNGWVRVFALTGDSWTEVGPGIDGEDPDNYFGDALALSGDGATLAVGAPSFSTTGHVRVFARTGDAWTQIGPDIDGEERGGRFGFSVALSHDGTTLAVGEPGQAAGQALVFERSGDTWTQIGQAIEGEVDNDGFGLSLALSADAVTLAVGAPRSDGSRSRTDSGQVRVFQRSGNTWNQIGLAIDGERFGDASGTSVALSANGTTLAIGAPRNDGNGSLSGHVRVFQSPAAAAAG